MIKIKKIALVLSAALIAVSSLVACGKKETQSTVSSGEVPSVASTSSVASVATGPREIIDMAGRTVTLPAEVNKVFTASANDSIFVYTIAPEKLLGWNFEPNDLEKKMILPEYHNLPVFGANDKINLEAVIAAAPDVCVQYGKIGKDDTVENADKLQNQLGIPVLVISTELLDTPAVYRFLGDVMGEQAAANERADYAQAILDEAAAVTIAEGEAVSFFYGNGANSLETAPAGSVQAQSFELAHLKNVVEVETSGGGRVEVTLEQVLTWNPNIIFVNGEPKSDISGNSAAEAILKDPAYAQVQAVIDAKVYGIPKAPFSWMDRPQGPNRLIGIQWAGHLAYPSVFTYDMEEKVREFYKLFYHIELNDEQLASLYAD